MILQIEVPDYLQCEDLVKKSLKSFNEDMEKEEIPYEFDISQKDYFFRIAKKNGKPKTDFPKIDNK